MRNSNTDGFMSDRIFMTQLCIAKKTTTKKTLHIRQFTLVKKKSNLINSRNTPDISKERLNHGGFNEMSQKYKCMDSKC